MHIEQMAAVFLQASSTVSRHCNATFSTLPSWKRHQHARYSFTTSIWHSVDHPVVSGDVFLVDTTARGSTRSKRTITTLHLQTSGGMPSNVVTEE